jgi:hypothetical protein
MSWVWWILRLILSGGSGDEGGSGDSGGGDFSSGGSEE